MSRPSGAELLSALEQGTVRAASPKAKGPAGVQNGAAGWDVHPWVKEGILDIFRTSPITPMDWHGHGAQDAPFRDKEPLPLRRFAAADDVRLVPGGSAVRRGAHLGPGVVCMPPMYVNIGAFVGAGSMVDSHALVGSCAQVGEGVHLSAAVQVGGVLEPVGARPVIIEDGAFLGGGVGVYEGVGIGRRAVLAAGVILTASTPVFDLVHERELRGSPGEPVWIPAGAVVIPGQRPASGAFARARGLGMSCALIVKYRDEKTDAGLALEGALRGSPHPA